MAARILTEVLVGTFKSIGSAIGTTVAVASFAADCAKNGSSRSSRHSSGGEMTQAGEEALARQYPDKK